MLKSLLIALSFWGTDPDNVFVDDYTSRPQSALLQDRLSPSDTQGTSAVSQVSNRVFSEPFVARAQTVNDEIQDGFYDMGFPYTWDDPEVQHLIAELNPFVPLNFPVLKGYFDPYGWQMLTGSTGPQDYRLGWSTFNEISVLPATPAFGTTGNMKVVEWSSNAKYSGLIRPGVLFDGTFWFSARWWDGPSGIALPAQVDQISSDLLLGFFNDGPWSAQIAFHPQLVETYEARIDHNAFNFDGRAIATYNASPNWKLVGGVAIWDRVNTLVVPHVGAIWTPDDRWEIRALFPRSRISYFMGCWRNADFWIYGEYDYIAEAYQAIIENPRTSDCIQITDQRLTAGLRCDSGRYTFFTEAGYVFDRRAIFAGSTLDFNLGDTAIMTVGLRY